MLNSKTTSPILLTLCFLAVSNLAQSATLEMCNQVSNAVNSQMPMIIDSENTARTTFCIQSGNKKPALHYMISTKVTHPDFATQKRHSKNFWCSDPRQKEALSYFDVQYEYRNASGIFIGFVDVNISMCR